MGQSLMAPDLGRAVRTNRAVLTACAAGLVVVLALVGAASDGSAPDLVGLLGLAAVAAGVGLVALDAWVRLPRPAPRTVRRGAAGAVRLRSSLGAAAALVLLAGGLTLIALSFLLGPSLESVSEGRRGGGWVYVVVVAAPLLLAGAVALLVRRDQVLLAPDGLSVRRFGREHTVRWDAVRQVGHVPGNPGLVLRIDASDGATVLVPTRQLALTLAELTAVVRHLTATPADRARLGEADALTMLEGLRRGDGRG